MNVFYDNLINIHELHLELDSVGVPHSHRRALMELADSVVHHEVFDLIMVELPPAHHEHFLEIFAADPSDPEILNWLRVRIPDVETKIRARGESVKYDLKSKIRSHK